MLLKWKHLAYLTSSQFSHPQLKQCNRSAKEQIDIQCVVHTEQFRFKSFTTCRRVCKKPMRYQRKLECKYRKLTVIVFGIVIEQ